MGGLVFGGCSMRSVPPTPTPTPRIRRRAYRAYVRRCSVCLGAASPLLLPLRFKNGTGQLDRLVRRPDLRGELGVGSGRRGVFSLAMVVTWLGMAVCGI